MIFSGETTATIPNNFLLYRFMNKFVLTISYKLLLKLDGVYGNKE